MARLWIASIGAVVVALSTLLAPAASWSQDATSGFAQVELTDELIQKFIVMQQKINAMADEIEKAGDNAAEKLRDKLDAIASESGLGTFDDFDRVASSITLVVAGIDPDTRAYSDPRKDMAADIEDIKADTSLNKEERDELIKDLEEAIANTPDVAYPVNIELVRKFINEIEAVLE
ncbi:MAG: hypothetical protein ACFCUN_06955 [Hyphomicrobiaceae bacterium]